jgi:hypothetical protein
VTDSKPVLDLSVSDLLDAMRRLGRQVSFYPSLAKIVGIKEAIFLQQLVYWTPKAKNERGWIYKSAEDFEEETSLSYREQKRVRATLRQRGLIEERYSRDEHRLYFRVVRAAVKSLTPEGGAPDETSDAQHTKRQVAPDETYTGTLPFVSSLKEQESTTEIPTESRGIDSRQDASSGAVATPRPTPLSLFSTPKNGGTSADEFTRANAAAAAGGN